jgi:hypothetical protein
MTPDLQPNPGFGSGLTLYQGMSKKEKARDRADLFAF